MGGGASCFNDCDGRTLGWRRWTAADGSFSVMKGNIKSWVNRGEAGVRLHLHSKLKFRPKQPQESKESTPRKDEFAYAGSARLRAAFSPIRSHKHKLQTLHNVFCCQIKVHGTERYALSSDHQHASTRLDFTSVFAALSPSEWQKVEFFQCTRDRDHCFTSPK